MSCIFCAIVTGQAKAACVWETPHTLAFLDHRPLFPGHLLVIPKRHVVTLPELEPEEVEPLFAAARLLARAVPAALGAQGTFVAINNRVSQTVFHLHVHVVPRTRGDGLKGFFWPRHPYRDAEHQEQCRQALEQAAEQEEILDFWFRESHRKLWFAQDPAFDQTLRDRYAETLTRALAGQLTCWARTPRGRLAAILVLDQFSRNLYRHTARAFAADPQALALCLEGLNLGHDRELSTDEKAFFYLPLEHAEEAELQERSVALYEALGEPRYLEFARRHQAIIARFGRFPHRNECLGRASSPEEAAFLREPESSFW